MSVKPTADQSKSTNPVAGAALHAALWLGLLLVFYFTAPTFVRLFEEFEVALPMMTVLAIELSRRVTRYWYLFALGGVVLGVADLAILLLLSNKKAGRIWSMLMTIVPLGLFVLLVLAFVVPFLYLLRDLS